MAEIPATASRRTYREGAEFTTPAPIVVCGSFEAASTSPTNVRGEGFTVSHTGTTGVYQVTFATPYPMLISCTASVQADTDDTLDDLAVQVGTYDSATGVLQILTYDVVATPALTDGAASQRVNFTAVFHKRSAISATYTS